ncbi:TIGR02234 family membrane protein [Nocardia higoensis]|uniref:TIGR02234 family membrane protein n=1 Tax=Nocardia higoensis TaxID=228599 RepID=A0ABS0DHX5_9NOCA|nr:TIGR02234 family membrane protein [Nocardia higoensis]MBF6358073.1 TIGR02234 family membrane protein [Nocardia higoensis]
MTGSGGLDPAADPDRFDPAADRPAAAGGAPRAARPVVPVALLALAAALMWGASRLTWVTVSSADGLTEPRVDELKGAVWFGALTPLALVLLAAVAAVLATKGWPRRLVGVLVALIGAVTAVPAFALLTGSGATAERAGALAELPGRATVTEVQTSTLPAVVTVLAALCAFGAGLLLARMPRETTGPAGRYDAPGARKAAAAEAVAEQRSQDGSALSERVLWDALDAGEDPTEDDPRTGDGPPGSPK